MSYPRDFANSQSVKDCLPLKCNNELTGFNNAPKDKEKQIQLKFCAMAKCCDYDKLNTHICKAWNFDPEC